MPESGYIAVFLIGLLGGVHCAGMCGGIVGALAQPAGGKPRLLLHLAYNAGRIGAYVAAGALFGAIGGAGLLLNGVLPVQIALYVAANLMLVALGAYLIGFTRVLAPTEQAGQFLWRKLRPLTARFLPATKVSQALPLGMLWGFLPCGMVYSVLATALVSGSALRGAGLMAAFGLGTLPNLLAAGVLLARLNTALRVRALRLASGLLVLGFGLWGLARVSTLGGDLWRGIVCTV
ncbi:MAG: sulfite exporter TauE/SafE family protein [Rhodocyclaceae bacterium]